MSLPDELNRVLKYGRLRPQEDWAPHIDAIHDSVKGVSGVNTDQYTEHARLILADKFADEGDPREHILRRVDTPESHAIRKGKVAHYGSDDRPSTARIRLSDGSNLTADLVAPQQKAQPDVVHLHWFGRTGTGGFRGFGAYFDPDQARHILSQFHPDDAPGIENLIGLIDKHFPKA